MSCGLDPAHFWALTPRELSLHIAGKRLVLVREYNDRMSLAWHIGMFRRVKNMPKLASLMHTDKPQLQQRQTPEEQIAVFKGILAARKRKG